MSLRLECRKMLDFKGVPWLIDHKNGCSSSGTVPPCCLNLSHTPCQVRTESVRWLVNLIRSLVIMFCVVGFSGVHWAVLDIVSWKFGFWYFNTSRQRKYLPYRIDVLMSLTPYGSVCPENCLIPPCQVRT